MRLLKTTVPSFKKRIFSVITSSFPLQNDEPSCAPIVRGIVVTRCILQKLTLNLQKNDLSFFKVLSIVEKNDHLSSQIFSNSGFKQISLV